MFSLENFRSRSFAPVSLRRIGIAAFGLIAASVSGAAQAQTPAEFYKGKNVTMIVGNPPGATYDIWARFVARYLGRHIPGAPNIVVQNMPGAGSSVSANYIYNVAPKDGLTIGLISNTTPIEPLFGVEGNKFDSLKINWLGSPTQDTAVVMLWHTVPVNTLDEAKIREIRMGSTSLIGASAFYMRIFNDIFKTKFSAVLGYPGLGDVMLAMERGEVEGHPSPYWSYLKNAKPAWLAEKKVKFLLQYGRTRNPELPDVPFAHDLATNDEDRALLDASVSPLALGYPFYAGPGVPADRIAALRQGFDATFRDNAFLEEAKTQNFDIKPLSGADLQASIEEAYGMPQSVADRLRRLYQGDLKK